MNFTVDEDISITLQNYAKKTGNSMSSIINGLLKKMFEENDEKTEIAAVEKSNTGELDELWDL